VQYAQGLEVKYPTAARNFLPAARFVAASLVCIVLAHHAAALGHEYAHALMAFALGDKPDPLDIHFGGASVANLLLLSEIDEHVDYTAMFSRGADVDAAFVGFAGPGLGNGAMYLVSLIAMRLRFARERLIPLLFLYWFNLMNVGNFFSYVPIRTFVSHGDIGHITRGLHVPAWVALVGLGIPTAMALWWLFTRTMPSVCARLAPDAPLRRAFIVTLSVVIVFGFFGLAGWRGYGHVSHALAVMSLCLIPVALFIALRPGTDRRQTR